MDHHTRGWLCCSLAIALGGNGCGKLSQPGALALAVADSDPDSEAASAAVAATPAAATSTLPEQAAPIVAAPHTWSFVPIPGSVCANGSGTGIGIYPVADANLLVIYFEGGGRCDSAASCSPPAATTPATAVANLGGFGREQLDRAVADAGGIFNRADAKNPAAHASFVYMPYCTGDDHSGDHRASYGIEHRGHANVSAMLPAVVATFGAVDQVLLTGSSAGGSGALWNYVCIGRAFGAIPVTLIDDAGPFLGAPYQEISAAAVAEWDLAATVPPGCTDCLPGGPTGGLQNFYPFFATALPGHRAALVTSDQDAHVAARDGLSGRGFAAALGQLRARAAASDPGFRFYIVPSTQHTWLGGAQSSLAKVEVGGVSLDTFIAQALADDPAWRSLP